jgi:hypothetical protein
MKGENSVDLIVNEVQKEYTSLRTSEKSRATAISMIIDSYGEATQDEEDYAAVIIGLVLALCKKKELTKEIAEAARTVVCDARNCQNIIEPMARHFVKVESLLNDETLLGDEATYKRRVPYVPDWKIGDTFSHTIMCDHAKKLGIDGWQVLFHKVGEFVDESCRHRQLMYVLLCPPGTEPVDNVQFQNLEFLRMMKHGEKWDYLTQITIKNKKDELLYGLQKIGNFPNISYPADRTDEDPLTAMPMFGCLKSTDSYPCYEEQICRIYKTNHK